MAIWQFSLVVIPQKGLIEEIGFVPEKLFIDLMERKQFSRDKLSNENVNELKYKDALTKDWWASTNLSPMEVIHQMDKLVKRGNWRNDTWIGWKTYSYEHGIEIDNDAYLSINSKTGKIDELSFRADLREHSWLFLTKMIELGQLYDWVFMDSIKGTIAQADKKEMKKLVFESNAFRFLKDPKQFLNELDNDEIE